MTELTEQEKLDEVIAEYHEAQEALLIVEDQVTSLIGVDVPKHKFPSAVRLQLREQHPNIYNRYRAAYVAHEQAFAQMRLREVRAHEWMQRLREGVQS